MLVDSHAHLNFQEFVKDEKEVITRCQKRRMKVINVGSQLETSLKAIEIAEDFDGFFASIGLHPIHLGNHQRDSLETVEHRQVVAKGLPKLFEQLSQLANNSKVVAIGETGFDYFRISGDADSTKKLQEEYFIKHLKLAQVNNLPLVLHCRGSENNPFDAYEEVLAIIKAENLRGVIHCFGADWELAKRFIDLGMYVGFTGIVTFKKKAEELQKVARLMPLENILIETDSPYLAPEPHRGERNEPIYVEYVARKIAELKNVSLEEVIEITGENAVRLFGI